MTEELEPNGNGNGELDEYPDEGEQLRRALDYVARRPRQSVAVTLEVLKRKIWEVGTNVIAIKDDVRAIRRRQDTLWNDYQQRLGRERLITWWLAFLTVVIGAIGLYVTVTHH